MTTTLCDVHVGKLRKESDRAGRTYQDLKEWMSYTENVYIARRGVVFVDKVRWSKQASIWANPFKLDKDATDEDRDLIVGDYYYYIREKIINENLYDELMKLKGKNLGCWCWGKICHGEVLIWLINKYETEGSI